MSERRGGTLGRVLAREPILVAAVVVLAALVRLPDLFGWWLNPDEGIYYGVVTRDGLAAAWREAMVISHPPLYLVFLRAVAWLSTDFAALRALSFVSGCAAVYLFVLLGREAARGMGGGRPTERIAGLASGLILAVSPRAIALSQVMRQYTPLLLVLAAALLLLLRYLREPTTRRLVTYGTLVVVAVLLHYSTIFALGVFGVLTLVDGVRRGMARPAWRRLVAAQAVPALTLVVLYFVHLRRIRADLGDHALDGWLAGFMIGSPRDAWLAFVGFHSMLAGETWAAPAAVLTLGAAVWAWKRGGWSPVLVAAVSGLAIAFIGAAIGLYPFGPTRHAAWLLVFVVPLIAWAAAAVVTSGRPTLAGALPAALLLALGARALRPVLDPEGRPREISEHVLRMDAVQAMSEVLDPQTGPPLVVMSTETYQQLTPLFAEERQTARSSPDGQLLRFAWGQRDVVVLPNRDIAVRPEQLGQANHLYTGIRTAERELGATIPHGDDRVLVLAGGWRSQGIEDLVEMANRVGPLGTSTSVPGLIAVYLDFDAYRRALGIAEG